MNQKEKDDFDALMKIADFNIKQFNERRNYSWKITFGFWGAIIGSITILSPHLDSDSVLVILLFGILVVTLHISWLSDVFGADKKDKDFAFEMRDEAIKLLKLKPPKKEDKSFWEDWSARFQNIVTIFLVIVAIFVILLPN